MIRLFSSEDTMSSGNPMDDIHDDEPTINEEKIVEEITQQVMDHGIESVTDMIPDDLPETDYEDDYYEDENIPMVATGMLPDVVNVGDRQMPLVMKDDLDSVRNNVTKLITSGMQDIKNLSELARAMEHPRVYETLANMMNTMKGLNEQLLSLTEKRHKMMRELEPADAGGVPAAIDPGEGGVHTNNNIQQAVFVGSTADLQAFCKNKQMAGATPTS